MKRGLIARLLRGRPPEAGEPVPDAALLARFVGAGDEAAFELLVWRHAALVLGVCRRIVRDDHLAEDAFQAAFLVLARKAGSVRGANLAGWLFRVSRRVASRARRQAETRAKRERPLTTEPRTEPHDHAEKDEIKAILDDEIARLPERLRLPVLLCYLGGRTTEDAARVLGCPRGTVLSRLATARQRLAARLTRRGVTLPAGVLGTTVVPGGVGSVSGVVPPAVRAVVGVLAGGSGGVVSNPVFLANGVLTAMKLGKTLTTGAVLVLTAGAFGGYAMIAGDGGGLVAPRANADPPKATTPDKPNPEAVRAQEAEQLSIQVRKLQVEIMRAEEDAENRLDRLRRDLMREEELLADVREHRPVSRGQLQAAIDAAEDKVATTKAKVDFQRAASIKPDEQLLARWQEAVSKEENGLAKARNAKSTLEQKLIAEIIERRQTVSGLEQSIKRVEREVEARVRPLHRAVELLRARELGVATRPGEQEELGGGHYDVKLDQVLKELRELRREVRELKGLKQK